MVLERNGRIYKYFYEINNQMALQKCSECTSSAAVAHAMLSGKMQGCGLTSSSNSIGAKEQDIQKVVSQHSEASGSCCCLWYFHRLCGGGKKNLQSTKSSHWIA